MHGERDLLRLTGRRSSPIEQAPTAQASTSEEVRKNGLDLALVEKFESALKDCGVCTFL